MPHIDWVGIWLDLRHNYGIISVSRVVPAVKAVIRLRPHSVLAL